MQICMCVVECSCKDSIVCMYRMSLGEYESIKSSASKRNRVMANKGSCGIAANLVAM